jgi:hypothetical protein
MSDCTFAQITENWSGDRQYEGTERRRVGAGNGGNQIRIWRRGWDSNPREACTSNGFQVRRVGSVVVRRCTPLYLTAGLSAAAVR